VLDNVARRTQKPRADQLGLFETERLATDDSGVALEKLFPQTFN